MKTLGPKLVFLLAAGSVALACGEVWARAGGGGGYGGGGGFSGEGGGSGGGGGLFYVLIWLCWRHPIIGIPIAIAVVAFLALGGRGAKNHHVTRTIRRGRQHQAERLLVAGREAIERADSKFDLQRFQERVAVAFGKIQAAWSAQEMTSVRPFISDGIHERFSLQIGMQKAQGFRNVMEDVRVLGCEPVAIESNAQFDTIHFRIRAAARDYRVSLTSKATLPGSDHSGTFTEYWSFHRRRGAETLAGDGAIEGNCPRCGAPLKIVDVARCESCDAQVNSGQFDWVLAEITQAQEWQVPERAENLPGLPELRQRDPGFTIQHVEDRVSVMFYRQRAAEFYGEESYAAPVVTPDYRAVLNGGLEQKQFFQDPVIGVVELLGATAEEGYGRLLVKVRWSGTWTQRAEGRDRVLRPQTIYTQIYSLLRSRQAKSVPEGTFSSAGCANCGAPIAVNEQGACSFCGTVLTNGEHDWVLEGVEPYTATALAEHFSASAEQPEVSHSLIPPSDVRLPLAVLAHVMTIDGRLDQRERETLERMAGRRGLSSEDVGRLIRQSANADGWLPRPADSREAAAYLDQLVGVLLIDGQLSQRERSLLARYGRQLGYSRADLNLALRRQRRGLYRQARAELQGKV